MSIADAFRTLLANIRVANSEVISLRYGEITSALNQEFRNSSSPSANSLQVGSYGRWTAIRGVSDLDMLYILPDRLWASYETGGQSDLLERVKGAIIARYPRTNIRVDRLVVRVLYSDFHIEVQPVFEHDNGSFLYPDTYGGGAWKVTRPRDEIAEIARADAAKNQNLRRLSKLARAWKNRHGVAIGGLLIDTLAHRFLGQTVEYDDKSYLWYDYMTRDFFRYLADQPKQDFYAALGSGQRVRVKKDFRKKAEKAHELCIRAIEAENSEHRNDRWRKVFGRVFPPRPGGENASSTEVTAGTFSAPNTEEFIEDRFPVDIRYSIEIDCEVKQSGFREILLRDLISRRWFLLPNKSLHFFVTGHTVPEPFHLYWKVLNRGPEAVRRKQVRGQISEDTGRLEKIETTNFRGDHLVECYAVKDGVVVATDRVHVPISSTEN